MPAAGMACTWLRTILRPSSPLGGQNAPLSSATHTDRTQCYFVIWMTEMDLKMLIFSCAKVLTFRLYRKSEIICNNTSICRLCCKLKVWNDSSYKNKTKQNTKKQQQKPQQNTKKQAFKPLFGFQLLPACICCFTGCQIIIYTHHHPAASEEF